jgi:hypothetical protein
LLETCELHGTSEDFIYLADATAGSGNLRLGGSRTRDMIRLLTQTYENSNKGLWATRDLRDNNEIYEAHMFQTKEEHRGSNVDVITWTDVNHCRSCRCNVGRGNHAI